MRKTNQPHDSRLQVRLTRDEADRLAKLAEADGVSMAARLRRMIREAALPRAARVRTLR